MRLRTWIPFPTFPEERGAPQELELQRKTSSCLAFLIRGFNSNTLNTPKMPKSLEKLSWGQRWCWHWDKLKLPHRMPYSHYPNPATDVGLHSASIHLQAMDHILLPIYSCRIQYPLAFDKVQCFSELPEVQDSLGNVRVPGGLSGSWSKQE